MVKQRQHQILLVEDSPSDALLAIRAIAESTFDSQVRHAKDGVEALEMLCGNGHHAEGPRPDLILLDLNMPRKDGRDVLRELNSDDDLRVIPVVIMSTSAEHNDITDTYRLGANSYMVKPVELREFFDLMQVTQEYWFQTCVLPQQI